MWKLLYNCARATAHDLPSRSTCRAPCIGYSLLRADRLASSRPKNQRTATLRRYRALSACDYPMGAAARFHLGRDPRAVLRFSQCHSRFATLASAVSEKTRRTRCLDGRHHDSPALARENDARLPVRDSRAMRQRNFLEHWQERNNPSPGNQRRCSTSSASRLRRQETIGGTIVSLHQSRCLAYIHKTLAPVQHPL